MIGIISDIHGNLPGLNLVLEKLSNHGCHKIICLGDLVDGGDYNSEVVDRIKKLNIPCVRGNHDETNSANLDDNRQSWLNSLPGQIYDDGIYYTHISPRPIRKRKIKSPTEAWNAFDETEFRVAFVGHTHVSVIFMDGPNHIGSSLELDFKFNVPITLNAKNRYIISPGAIGYSRDNRKTLRYGLFDNIRNSIAICELNGPTIQ